MKDDEEMVGRSMVSRIVFDAIGRYRTGNAPFRECEMLTKISGSRKHEYSIPNVLKSYLKYRDVAFADISEKICHPVRKKYEHILYNCLQ